MIKTLSPLSQTAKNSIRVMAPILLTVVGGFGVITYYNFWRLEKIRSDLESVNRFYVPILRHLHLIHGKWQVYQKSFEQNIGFRSWGTKDLSLPAVHRFALRKMIDPHLQELKAHVSGVSILRFNSQGILLEIWTNKLAEYTLNESRLVHELEAFLKYKNFTQAASRYSQIKNDQQEISHGLLELEQSIEAKLAETQQEAELELGHSQNRTLVVLLFSLLGGTFILFRLRRWLMPIMEWTAVAQEIALKGMNKEIVLPRIRQNMPPEIALLTSEFTRMAITVLEREKTIHQQKEKLEDLNSKLKDQNERLLRLGFLNDRIFNGMSSGLMLVNPDGRIAHCNEQLLKIFGIEKSQLLLSDFELVFADINKFNLKLDEDSKNIFFHSKTGFKLKRIRLDSPTFSSKVVDIEMQPLDANHIGLLYVFDEITALVETEQKLEHAQKLILAGNFSAQVAHEVRNPLHSMSLQIEMLKDDIATNELNSVQKRIEILDEQVSRLDRMTERYLQVEHGARPWKVLQDNKKSVDLLALIEKGLVFLASEIQSAQVKVEFVFDSKIEHQSFFVLGDEDSLMQVFLNLIRNALEAFIPGQVDRRIQIHIWRELQNIRIQVLDNGSGVSPKIRERLFEPFVSQKADGVGIGLCLSRQICHEHGGQLEFMDPSLLSQNRLNKDLSLKNWTTAFDLRFPCEF